MPEADGSHCDLGLQKSRFNESGIYEGAGIAKLIYTIRKRLEKSKLTRSATEEQLRKEGQTEMEICNTFRLNSPHITIEYKKDFLERMNTGAEVDISDMFEKDSYYKALHCAGFGEVNLKVPEGERCEGCPYRI